MDGRFHPELVADLNRNGWQVWARIYKDKIDIKTIEKLIDQKYEIKKEKVKALINSYAELKNILSDEQKAKLKSISLNKRKMK